MTEFKPKSAIWDCQYHPTTSARLYLSPRILKYRPNGAKIQMWTIKWMVTVGRKCQCDNFGQFFTYFKLRTVYKRI